MRDLTSPRVSNPWSLLRPRPRAELWTRRYVVDHAVEILRPPGVLSLVRSGQRHRILWTRRPPDGDTHRLTCTYAQGAPSTPQARLSRLWMTRPRHDTHTKCWGPVFRAPQGVVSIPSGGPGDR